MSLSDYLLMKVRGLVEQPSLEEMRDRLRHRTSVTLSPPAAELVRAERDRR
jgi:hypothetical protein